MEVGIWMQEDGGRGDAWAWACESTMRARRKSSRDERIQRRGAKRGSSGTSRVQQNECRRHVVWW